jgi:hypothetical protein
MENLLLDKSANNYFRAPLKTAFSCALQIYFAIKIEVIDLFRGNSRFWYRVRYQTHLALKQGPVLP